MKSAASASPPRILIVDDHGTSRQFMVDTLRRCAVQMRQARNSSEALQLALGWLPHAILLDVRLAGEDGYATARQIRERWPPTRPLPRIVMISADPPESAGQRHTAVEADGFLLKPFTPRQLTDAALGTSPPPLPPPSRQEPVTGDLQRLFRTELTTRLQVLDRCLAGPDLAAARGVLHQLIASAALCGQRRLEHDLRRLYDACQNPTEASTLARCYSALLFSARDYLGEP